MNPNRTAPLRKIVNYATNEFGTIVEVLECGHQQRPIKDQMGETVAVRRRCHACRRALHKAVS